MRRARLYYLQDLTGKAARVTEHETGESKDAAAQPAPKAAAVEAKPAKISKPEASAKKVSAAGVAAK